MKRLLSRIFGLNTTASKRSLQKKSMLQIEDLESRWCPSCTVATVDGGHTLVIKGDNTNNIVSLVQNDTTNKLKVVCDGQTTIFSSNQITKIKVDLKGGDDKFGYDLAAGTSYSYGKDINIKLGNGHDEAFIDFRGGGIGGTSWLLSSLDIKIDAGKGNDDLVAHFNGKHGGHLNVYAKMGDGNDEAFVSLWGDVTGGADVLFDIKGNKGNDWLHSWNTFDNKAYSYGSIDITHDSTVTMKMDGGCDQDKVSILYSGEVDGKLTLKENGGKGHDEVSAVVYLKPTSAGSLSAHLFGDKGNDKLDFELVDNSGGAVDILAAVLHGNQGFDTCTATPNVAVFGCEA